MSSYFWNSDPTPMPPVTGGGGNGSGYYTGPRGPHWLGGATFPGPPTPPPWLQNLMSSQNGFVPSNTQHATVSGTSGNLQNVSGAGTTLGGSPTGARNWFGPNGSGFQPPPWWDAFMQYFQNRYGGGPASRPNGGNVPPTAV